MQEQEGKQLYTHTNRDIWASIYFTDAEVLLVHGLVGRPLDVPESISLRPAAVKYRSVWLEWLIRVSACYQVTVRHGAVRFLFTPLTLCARNCSSKSWRPRRAAPRPLCSFAESARGRPPAAHRTRKAAPRRARTPAAATERQNTPKQFTKAAFAQTLEMSLERCAALLTLCRF